MPILAFILLFFIAIPLLEIYLLIEVGGVIGAFPTVIAVVFTAVLGVTLIRIQGFSTIQKAQTSMRQGIVPATEMFEGIMLLFAAICLLIPGFFTDALGFLLLIPPLRMLLARHLIGSAMLKTRFQTTRSDFFEGEYEDLTPEQQHQRAQNRLHHRDIIEGRVESDDDRE